MSKLLWILVAVICVIVAKVDIVGFYRKTYMIIEAMRESTKSGYLNTEKGFNPDDLNVNVAGRSFLITGSSGGIGKSTALTIAKKGGTVHMLCRNRQKAEIVKDELISESGNENVYLHIADMSKMSDIHDFVSSFSSKHDHLDVLINNAAVMTYDTRIVTSEGLELGFATNTMGYYTLTMSLLPLLRKSTEPRVVIVSSNGMFVHPLKADDLQSENVVFDGSVAYVRHKRQQIVVGEEWAKLYPDVRFYSMHPGWADTPGLRDRLPDFYKSFEDNLRTSEQGADTIVWLAVSEAALSFKSGLFFLDRSPTPTHMRYAWTEENEEDRQKLMKSLDELYEKMKPT